MNIVAVKKQVYEGVNGKSPDIGRSCRMRGVERLEGRCDLMMTYRVSTMMYRLRRQLQPAMVALWERIVRLGTVEECPKKDKSDKS